MSNLRMTGSALLATVTETASAANDVIKTVSTGARMLNDFVEDARSKQSINIKLGKVAYQESILNSRMIEIDQIREQSADYMDEKPERRARCELIHKQLMEALA